jgi:hypothetical protein
MKEKYKNDIKKSNKSKDIGKIRNMPNKVKL